MLLKNGSTGNYVMYLQYGLHIMCCPPGSFDSKFGSGTEKAAPIIELHTKRLVV